MLLFRKIVDVPFLPCAALLPPTHKVRVITFLLFLGLVVVVLPGRVILFVPFAVAVAVDVRGSAARGPTGEEGEERTRQTGLGGGGWVRVRVWYGLGLGGDGRDEAITRRDIEVALLQAGILHG